MPVTPAESGEVPSFSNSSGSSIELELEFFPSGELLGNVLFDSPPKRATDIVNDERKGLCAY